MNDPDQELLAAAREALQTMADCCIDFTHGYARLLAAVDAKERAVIDEAKAMVSGVDEAAKREMDERIWAWMGSSKIEQP